MPDTPPLHRRLLAELLAARDPAGLSLEKVGTVRDEIGQRVLTLIGELDADPDAR